MPARCGASLAATTIGAQAADPLDPLHSLVADVRGILESRDNGQIWQLHDVGSSLIHAIVFAPSSPETVHAGGEAPGGGASASDAVYRSLDRGATWSGVGLPGAAVDALAVDPLAPGTVYAAVAAGGVQRSTDGGATWSAASLAGHRVAALATDARFPGWLAAGLAAEPPAATGETGAATSAVWISRDRGATWRPLGSDLSPAAGVTALAFGTSPSRSFYAATAGGIRELADALPSP